MEQSARLNYFNDLYIKLVSGQSKHYQVIVGAVYAVACIGAMRWRVPRMTHKVHNFVLPFTRDVWIAQSDLNVFPRWVLVKLAFEVNAKFSGQSVHEWTPGTDALYAAVLWWTCRGRRREASHLRAIIKNGYRALKRINSPLILKWGMAFRSLHEKSCRGGFTQVHWVCQT